MADQTNAEVSDERLRELVAGCEGVTPGPWKAIDKLHGRVAVISDNTGLVYGLTNDAPFPAVVAHIARLDPDTVKALATELLNRRSVTSQASEGAGWKLVPTNVTDQMYVSFREELDDNSHIRRFPEAYAAMLAAAPTAPVSKRVERLETAEAIVDAKVAEIDQRLRGADHRAQEAMSYAIDRLSEVRAAIRALGGRS